ncbi:MAG: SAM-dependent methyltransferase [Acidobacteria bacterium]|nr:SAM-dependent methyltransferase [Acidobacteriota bacterium]
MCEDRLVTSESLVSHYSLGSTDAEHRRLIQLASHEEDRVIDACRRANVGPNAVAIDLGCGPLGALAALANVVGSEGTVVGVDASGAALARARTLVASRFPQIRLIEADAGNVTARELGIEVADLAYSRLMLLHQPDPAATLANVARLLRSRGVFIAHEASDLPMHAPGSEPFVPAMTRVWELVIAAARARGARTDFARRGRAYLEDAGLRVDGTRAYAVHYPPNVGFEIPRVALQSLRPTLAQYALASEDEIAHLDRELEEAQRRTDVQWVSSPLMIEWIARRD